MGASLLSTKAALLLALRRGPGYGVDLIRRLQASSGGQVSLGRGNVYTALRALQRRGVLRSWEVVPGQRRGSRLRVYYELTAKGVSLSEKHRAALAGLVTAAAASPSDREIRLMAQRLKRCAELSAFVLGLRDRMATA